MHFVYAEWGKLALLLIVVMLNVITLSGVAPLSGIVLLGRLRGLTANITFKLERPAKDLHYSLFSCKIFEHFALQEDPVIGFIQPRSTSFKDSAILVPKLADPPF